MPHRTVRRRRDERGAALVEMLIAIALAGGVMAVAATLLVTGMRGNEQVTTTTRATSQGQGVAQGLERAVRNARRIKLDDCASPNTDCTTITVWTTLGGEAACQVWTLGTDGTIHVAQGATAPGATSPYGAGTAGAGLAIGSALLDSAGHVVGISYAVTYPSQTRPVSVTGSVRSRTPHDTTSPTTCGLTA